VSIEGSWSAAAAVFVQVATVGFVLRTSGARRATRVVSFTLAAVAAAIALGQIVGGSDDPRPVGLVPATSAALFLIALVVIVRHIALRPQVDEKSALGAIAAYLCLGMLFASLYLTIAIAQSGAFFGSEGDGSMRQMLFFSMTTLTTTGYGNLVPAGNPGQSFAVLEMVTGQLFLIIALGKIVSAMPTRRSRDSSPSS
jgi:Ion channel